MKKIKLLIIILFPCSLLGQSLIGTQNSGAVSENGLNYSIGEVYVIPTNPEEANSGILGALYQIELQILGVDDISNSKYISVFPNPVATSLNIRVNNGNEIRFIKLYDFIGKLIKSYEVVNNKIDLTDLRAGIYLLKTNLKTIKPLKIIKN